MFHTKGDANAVEDSEPVAAVNVVGKVVFVSAALGTVVSLFANPLVFLLLIVVPLVLLLGFEFAKLVKSTKEGARAEDEAALRAAVEEIRRKRAAEKTEAAAPHRSVTEMPTMSRDNRDKMGQDI